MLSEMRIQGLGVIDDATLELDPGLTVLTGETGAGKTMVVTGLSLLGGGRAEASRVAEGARRAVVEGRFLAGPQALAVADEVGADADEDGTLIAVRTVGADGRSRAHLGGRSVPVGVLGRLAEATLAVHGQNDQLRLLRPAEQRALLDRFAGDAVGKPLARYREVRAEWQRLAAELVQRRDGARRMAQEADMLRHGLTEIAAVDPQPGEDGELVAHARRLAAADDLRAVAAAAQAALVGADGADGGGGDPDAPAALALIGDARHRLAAAGDAELTALDARLGEALALLGDVGAELASYLDRLDADPDRLAAVLSRQAELKALTRKYAADVDGVLAWADEARERLGGLDTSEETLSALAARRDDLAVELAAHAAEVTAARREAAARLAADTTAELGGLAMADARLLVDVRPRVAGPDAADTLLVGGQPLVAGTSGVDEVELRLVAHGGAAPQPLHKGASGGELSRVMLALEVALAGADPVPTMVFDEVDAGVGGRAAVEIGRRLARLAARHQVIVVTHLPQVAAYADRHLVVDKSVRDGPGQAGPSRAHSRVRTLADGDRIGELARMLAGLDDTDTGRAHAEELLGTARAHRQADRAEATTGARRRGGRKRSGSGS
ncbi:DNA repair protein RecN [Pseudonocardia sp.]|uniref:DNA repair protein RecN n=1 Tax=Pseudonocardia sp. TaxID=60912 RepID=UPI002612D366|nr:DNA repair protein RecN [Pseudonocardia sp.]